jgi:hypothetical protein
MWGMSLVMPSFLSARDRAQGNDGTARYLNQEECEYYECQQMNKCENYWDQPHLFAGVEFEDWVDCVETLFTMSSADCARGFTPTTFEEDGAASVFLNDPTVLSPIFN